METIVVLGSVLGLLQRFVLLCLADPEAWDRLLEAAHFLVEQAFRFLAFSLRSLGWILFSRARVSEFRVDGGC